MKNKTRITANDIKRFPPHIQRQIQNHLAVPTANMESSISHEPLAKEGTPRFDRPTIISIHNRRKRLADMDGICTKYIIDAIVSAKILADDSPEYVPRSPIETQEKIGKEESEETIITLEEI